MWCTKARTKTTETTEPTTTIESLISSLQSLSIDSTSTRPYNPQLSPTPEPLSLLSTNRIPLGGTNTERHNSGYPGRMTSTCMTTRSNREKEKKDKDKEKKRQIKERLEEEMKSAQKMEEQCLKR
jgi:hypothetical protein